MSRQLADGEIRRAREAAAALVDEFFTPFQIDWTKTRADKRTGNMYGWTLAGEFLGQFTTHEKAIDAGARVVKLDNRHWFLYQDPKFRGDGNRKHANCGRPEWATCPECGGRVHNAECTARLDPKKDCCKRRGCKYALVE